MKAENGDLVKVHYTGKLDDGSIFDTSSGREPLLFRIGDHRVIPGFEKAVAGMQKGEKKTIKILPAEAYGERKEHLCAEIPLSQLGELPKKVELKKGAVFQLKDPAGNTAAATVTDVKADSIILDLNHPLAGKTLTFEIEIADVLRK